MKKIAMGTKIVRFSLIGSIWLSLLANFTSKLYLYQYFIIFILKASLSSRTTSVKTIYSNHTY